MTRDDLRQNHRRALKRRNATKEHFRRPTVQIPRICISDSFRMSCALAPRTSPSRLHRKRRVHRSDAAWSFKSEIISTRDTQSRSPSAARWFDQAWIAYVEVRPENIRRVESDMHAPDSSRSDSGMKRLRDARERWSRARSNHAWAQLRGPRLFGIRGDRVRGRSSAALKRPVERDGFPSTFPRSGLYTDETADACRTVRRIVRAAVSGHAFEPRAWLWMYAHSVDAYGRVRTCENARQREQRRLFPLAKTFQFHAGADVRGVPDAVEF